MSFQYFIRRHESQWRFYVNFHVSNTNFLNAVIDHLGERIDPTELDGLDYYEYYNLVDVGEDDEEMETEQHQPQTELELEQFMEDLERNSVISVMKTTEKTSTQVVPTQRYSEEIYRELILSTRATSSSTTTASTTTTSTSTNLNKFTCFLCLDVI